MRAWIGFPPPPLPLILSSLEYAVLRAALAYRFGREPVAIHPVAQEGTDPWALGGRARSDAMIRERLPLLDPTVLQSWRRHAGPYLFQDCFEAPYGLADLHPEAPSGTVVLSRPGLGPEQALVHLRQVAGGFDGLLLLRLQEGRWRVVAESHDEDWDPTEPEWSPLTSAGIKAAQSRQTHIPEQWRLVPAAYPQPDEGELKPFLQEDWERSDRLFSKLSRAEVSQDVLDQRVIPTLYDPPLSLREVLKLREILWGDPDGVAEALHAQGIPVLRWGFQQRTRWLGVLLVHLAERIPCWEAPQIWGVAVPVEPDARERQTLERVTQVLNRLGLPSRSVALAEVSDNCSWAPILTPGHPLFRLDKRTSQRQELENAAGTLYIDRGRIRDASSLLELFQGHILAFLGHDPALEKACQELDPLTPP